MMLGMSAIARSALATAPIDRYFRGANAPLFYEGGLAELSTLQASWRASIVLSEANIVSPESENIAQNGKKYPRTLFVKRGGE